MRTRIALALLFGLTLSAYVAADEKSDQDKIQGKWKMESGVKGGTPIPDDKKNVTIQGVLTAKEAAELEVRIKVQACTSGENGRCLLPATIKIPVK